MMRTLIKWFTLFLGALSVLLLAPQVVHAHAILDSSSPAASSVISSTPTEISLRFNEDVENKLASIRLFGSDQKEISIGTAYRDSSDFSHITAQVGTNNIQLGKGVYVVVWRAVSADGHPVNGAFPFEIGEQSSGSATQLLSDVLKNVDSESTLSNPIAASRLIAYLSTISLIGFLVFSWGQSRVTSRQLEVARFSGAGIVIGSALTLLMQGPYVAGKSWGSIFDSELLGNVATTRLGIALIVRMILSLVGLALVYAFTHHESAWWKNLAFLSCFGIVATFAGSGHASAGSLPIVFMIVDALHLFAIGVWIGGLVVISLADEMQFDSVSRFSRMATWAMPLTIGTGIIEAFHLMGGVSDITKTTYGKLLIVKVVMVLAIVAIGARARKRITSENAPIRKFVRRELAIVLVVLAVTSLLVGKTPTAGQGAASQPFTTTQLQGDVLASIEVAPTKVGVVAVHVILSPPGGALSPVKNVEVRFALQSRDIPAIPVNMVAIGPNHWSGVVQIPYSGTWDLEVRVKPTETETLLYTTQVGVTG